ncbi:bis(5'-nucleosyl)-tetraphosphatase (symmetrical) YqeK [Paenibacillus sp. GCM10023248]|uniref:bis(5'-nucleosyl)-tetraphosphatase (symmetrical) YqeK n=1 Tax=Bacillales TaxID=1385 RepID=UPI0023785EA4|nr:MULTISPECIES: bis(5'-nucleosyl)-tetraphosphatase (symmetrical) YqeK [Bacillales]MDD9268732.1 bis(5'-nucleosyl)-tetraphosphatase (symmetrical) YqeK [Paenibacillus sp. MAHUQ-63]MDR6880035.1 putative HD superfamily hydrolase involved in NAD metabolism [Bacillus sp. 3255]
MKREELIAAVKEQMPERRWLHTLGVMETSVILAKRFGGDPVKADLAAILHDYCKYWPVQEQAKIIRDNGLPPDLLDYDKELWHSHAGAFIAKTQFGIADEEILDAIRYHTSGREQMTLLDKIVCLADYMEPSREFPGVESIRQAAESSLEKALVIGFDSTIRFLIEKGKRIYPLTILTRNDLLQQLNE